MQAMVLDPASHALVLRERATPPTGPGQVLLRVLACGVCRTDLHILDGELPSPKPDLIPGHEVVGEVVALGPGVEGLTIGQRVGVPWLGWTCGDCGQCRAGRENLCETARFTGYTVDGGYAEYVAADARYCLPLPARLEAAPAAPLLCAGLIGYRAYRAAGPAPQRLGLYGFGAAAHLICQVAVHDGCEVFAFTRPGDRRTQQFARSLGAVWAGGSDEPPPDPLDASILFAPVGDLAPTALAGVRPGGTVVCAGIHMSDIPRFPYALLWGERVLRSVANLTREDGQSFMRLIEDIDVRTEISEYPLRDAMRALEDLRAGRFEGAAVLRP